MSGKIIYCMLELQEWSSFVQLLQTELSDSKQKNDQLEDELIQTQANVFKLQEEITRKEVITESSTIRILRYNSCTCGPLL